jgi:hypothetical protein
VEKQTATTNGAPWHTLATVAKYTHLPKGYLSKVIRRGRSGRNSMCSGVCSKQREIESSSEFVEIKLRNRKTHLNTY